MTEELAKALAEVEAIHDGPGAWAKVQAEHRARQRDGVRFIRSELRALHAAELEGTLTPGLVTATMLRIRMKIGGDPETYPATKALRALGPLIDAATRALTSEGAA